MPPKKSASKKEGTKHGKIIWSEVVEGYNVKEREMKPMKVTKICKYESTVNKRPIYRLAGEDDATGQKMSKFTTELTAESISALANIKIEKCLIKPKEKKEKKEKAKPKASAKRVVKKENKAEPAKKASAVKEKAEAEKAKKAKAAKAKKASAVKEKTEAEKAEKAKKAKAAKAKKAKAAKAKAKI